MQKHVLVVEDDNDILELLKLYLEASEFLVSVAYDGVEALDILKKWKNWFVNCRYNDAKDEWLWIN